MLRRLTKTADGQIIIEKARGRGVSVSVSVSVSKGRLPAAPLVQPAARGGRRRPAKSFRFPLGRLRPFLFAGLTSKVGRGVAKRLTPTCSCQEGNVSLEATGQPCHTSWRSYVQARAVGSAHGARPSAGRTWRLQLLLHFVGHDQKLNRPPDSTVRISARCD